MCYLSNIIPNLLVSVAGASKLRRFFFFFFYTWLVHCDDGITVEIRQMYSVNVNIEIINSPLMFYVRLFNFGTESVSLTVHHCKYFRQSLASIADGAVL